MKHLRIALLTGLSLIAAVTQAQHLPYAGDAGREIKALPPDEVKQYLSGAGMGYAKAAELNMQGRRLPRTNTSTHPTLAHATPILACLLSGSPWGSGCESR